MVFAPSFSGVLRMRSSVIVLMVVASAVFALSARW